MACEEGLCGCDVSVYILLAFKKARPDLNWGPSDLQSDALPLSYTPVCFLEKKNTEHINEKKKLQNRFEHGTTG